MSIPCRCCGAAIEPGAVCPVDGNVTLAAEKAISLPYVAPESEAEHIAEQQSAPVGESDYADTAVTRKPTRGNKR